MASILVFFKVFGSVVAVYPPKSGYPSAEAPYFDFELQYLVAAATQVKIESHKWFYTVFYGVSMDKYDWNSSEQLCPAKRLS